MSTVFKKLQHKDQTEILVQNEPESFETELEKLQGVKIIRDPADVQQIVFALTFVLTQEQVEASVTSIAPRAKGDALIWFAYPKGSSKKYECELNRDNGWDALGKAGFEAVRQVSIDEDWSALRFRRVEYIKKMIRRESFAMTEEGKKKIKG